MRLKRWKDALLPWPLLALLLVMVGFVLVRHGTDRAASAGIPSNVPTNAEEASGNVPGTEVSSRPSGRQDITRANLARGPATSVRIIDGNGSRIEGVEVFELVKGMHPRCLIDPTVHAVSRDGTVLLAGDASWLFYHPEFQPLEIRSLRDQVIMQRGERASIYVADSWSGAPAEDFPLFLSHSGLWSGYQSTCRRRIVPRAGHVGVRKVVSDARGRAVLSDLPPDFAGMRIYTSERAMLYSRAMLAGPRTDLQVPWYSIVDFHRGDLLAATVHGVVRPRLTPMTPQLWVEGAPVPPSSIVAPAVASMNCIGLSTKIGWFEFRPEIRALRPGRRETADLSRVRSVWPADGTLLVRIAGHHDMPVKVHTRHPFGGEHDVVEFVVNTGDAVRVPNGAYWLFDAIGRPLDPEHVVLPRDPVEARIRTPLHRTHVSIRCTDGLVPAFPYLVADGCRWMTWHEREEWLPAGRVLVTDDWYGSAEVRIPHADPGAVVEAEFVLEPRWKWYDDVPLGKECVALATRLGLVIDPERLSTESLEALARERELLRSERAAIAARIDATYEPFRARLIAEPQECFDEQGAFWRRAAVVEEQFEEELAKGRLWVFREVASEDSPWRGHVGWFDLAAHTEQRQSMIQFRAEKDQKQRDIREWMKYGFSEELSTIVRRASVE